MVVALVRLKLSIFDLQKKRHSCYHFQLLGRLVLWSVFYLRKFLLVIQMSACPFFFLPDVAASMRKYFLKKDLMQGLRSLFNGGPHLI